MPGQCREGFFDETLDGVDFTTWRVKDCLTGKTIKEGSPSAEEQLAVDITREIIEGLQR